MVVPPTARLLMKCQVYLVCSLLAPSLTQRPQSTYSRTGGGTAAWWYRSITPSCPLPAPPALSRHWFVAVAPGRTPLVRGPSVPLHPSESPTAPRRLWYSTEQ